MFNEIEKACCALQVKTEKSILRQRLVFLKHEKERFERLVKIAKPVELPTLKVQSNQAVYSFFK